jgi:hypothetical protein
MVGATELSGFLRGQQSLPSLVHEATGNPSLAVGLGRVLKDSSSSTSLWHDTPAHDLGQTWGRPPSNVPAEKEKEEEAASSRLEKKYAPASKLLSLSAGSLLSSVPTCQPQPPVCSQAAS